MCLQHEDEMMLPVSSMKWPPAYELKGVVYVLEVFA